MTKHHKSKENKIGKLIHVTNKSKLTPDLNCLRYATPVEQINRTWFRNTEDECWIAINPTNPKNMIIVTHQDRFVNFIADIILYTVDGGETWNESNITLSRCQ